MVSKTVAQTEGERVSRTDGLQRIAKAERRSDTHSTDYASAHVSTTDCQSLSYFRSINTLLNKLEIAALDGLITRSSSILTEQ